ncbi:MAG: hypothetical protein O3A47_06910 [Chloroflexi bacterium]|nr:hypothetical protein [Chloroflexota bacterium]
MHGSSRARDLWQAYGLRAPVDLKFVVEALGLEVVSFPFRGRIKESIVDGVIGVRPGLSRDWFRWYVAHAVGHHLMHVGTSFYLDSWQWASHAKSERQAEEFAAALLGGPDAVQRTATELGVPMVKLGLIQSLSDRWPDNPRPITLPQSSPRAQRDQDEIADTSAFSASSAGEFLLQAVKLPRHGGSGRTGRSP